jgi:hypothetical protein
MIQLLEVLPVYIQTHIHVHMDINQASQNANPKQNCTCIVKDEGELVFFPYSEDIAADDF